MASKDRELRRVAKNILKSTPLPARPRIQAPEFRPMTQDVWRLKIPKIKKKFKPGPPKKKARSVRFIFSLPSHEKEAIDRAARNLCLTQATIVRLAIKRFLRMPEEPLKKKAAQLWDEAIRRDVKQISARAAYSYAVSLLRDAGQERPLSMKHLEHKLAELIATNNYRKSSRTPLTSTGRTRPPGNPKGLNGRHRPDSLQPPPDGGVPDLPRRDQHRDSVVPATSSPRRLMIQPRKDV